MRVCIEGMDYSGKTTLSKRLAEHFKVPRFVFPDRETAAGKWIDRYLKGQMVIRTTDYTVGDTDSRSAFLFQCLHFTNRLEKTADLLAAPNCILDRYWPSGVAYGTSDGIGFDWLVKCSEALPVQPDIFILLDIPVTVAVERMQLRSGREIYDRFDKLDAIGKNYRRLWRQEREKDLRKWVILDASIGVDSLFYSVMDCLEQAGFQREG